MKAERRMSAARMETEAKVNIGISEEHRRSVVEILGTTLADEFLLYTKTRNYHWNVTGMQFNDLHKFFEAQYKELNEVVDEVAERIRYLGGRSLGTLNEFLQYTRLEEHPGEDLDARGMISRLLGDHETIIRKLRGDLRAAAEQYEDVGTQNFLTNLLEKHQKMAWMLRAFVTQ